MRLYLDKMSRIFFPFQSGSVNIGGSEYPHYGISNVQPKSDSIVQLFFPLSPSSLSFSYLLCLKDSKHPSILLDLMGKELDCSPDSFLDFELCVADTQPAVSIECLLI